MTPALPDLTDRARSLLHGRQRAMLGVTGPPGAGKSTLVDTLLAALRTTAPAATGDDWVAHVPMDGFHLADVELARLSRRNRKGAPDTFDAAGYVACLRRLRENTDDIVYVPGFQRDLEQPIAAAIPIPRTAALIITEGNYLLMTTGAWGRVRDYLDEVWYCDLDDAERRTRLVNRHIEYGKAPPAALAWVNHVDEANTSLITATQHKADLIVHLNAADATRAHPAPEQAEAARSTPRPKP